MTTQNSYDNLNRLTGRVSTAFGTTVGSFQYQYNAANQRTLATLQDGSYWSYGYDALGQVTNGNKYFWDGTPYAGQQFGYGFDTIGNRLSTMAGGDSNGLNLRLASYTNNALNQTVSRGVPGYVDVMGLTLATNTVQVNGTNAYQKWEYFREQVGTNNSSAPQWLGINVKSSGTNLATVSGSVFLARTPETNFSYDPDGNQTRDGRFTNTWDAENRLIAVVSLPGAPVASQYSNIFTYDYMGRRIQKMVSTNSGSGWAVPSTNKYVYDGWNLVAILDGYNNVLQTFTWGTDLSGMMQGAGGVGGLITMTVCAGTNAGTYFICYDGNGNVVALVNAPNGTIAANYEYGPFGELIRATGPLAKVNPFMFSTKFYDWETSLYYYGYRYYNPSTGRWLSRDPIAEKGGLNLYGFVRNSPIGRFDVLGLQTATLVPAAVVSEIEAGIAAGGIPYAQIAQDYSVSITYVLAMAATYEAGQAANHWLDLLKTARVSPDTSCPDPCKGNKDFEDIAKQYDDIVGRLWRPLHTATTVIGDGGAIDAAIWEAQNPGQTVGGQLHAQKIRDTSNELKKLVNRVNQTNKNFPSICQDRLRPMLETLKKKLDDAISTIDSTTSGSSAVQ
jgi:RHS repeat-associated protein